MTTPISSMRRATSGRSPQQVSLDKRLGVLFWALLFILAGTLWLLPEGKVPPGTWLMSFGLILLSLNAVRVLNGIPVRALSSLLGLLAVGAGVAEYFGAHMPVLSLTFIAIGVSIILELVATRKS